MKLLINSNIGGTSGYAKSLRELGAALRELGVDVGAVNIGGEGAYIPEKCYPLLKSKVELRKGDSLLFRPYFEPLPSVSEGVKIIAFVALESTRLPERLVRDCNDDSVSQVWVPSNHCKRYAIESGIIEDKLRVVPHGYDPNIFKAIKQKKDVGEAQPYKFLFVGGYTGRGDRKGADILTQAFHEEFKPNEKVELLMKINTTYGSFPSHDLAIDPRIKFNTNQILDSQMPEVYNEGDCFVFPTWGEAFGMTLLEAMACGLPIIKSWFGGQNDYVDDLNSTKDCLKRVGVIDGDVVQARYTPWDIGNWERPSKGQLRFMMRQFYEDKPPKKKYKGIERWTWDRAAAQGLKCLEEL